MGIITWFYIQGIFINGQIHGLVRRVTEILQDEVNNCGDFISHWFAEFHPAVHHNAAIPEVKDLQVFKVA